MCDKYANNLSLRQQEIKCRLCVYGNSKKAIRPNGDCSTLPDGQTYNVWGEIEGCDSSKCKCDSNKKICNECLDPTYFIYPDFQTCEPICREGRWAKGRICLKCDPNGQYMVDRDKSCNLCDKVLTNCYQCTESVCEKCKDGFGFNFFSQTKECIQCSGGFIKVGDFCIQQPQGCNKITESSLDLDRKKITCDQCSQAEMIKKNDGSCIKCTDGTFYDQNSQSCKNCSVKDCKYCPQNQCQSCKQDQQLVDGKCQQPLISCTQNSAERKYVDQGVCKECPQSFNYINDCKNYDNFCGKCLPCSNSQFIRQSDGSCQNCLDFCKTCETSNKCTECVMPGLTIKQGKCECLDIKKCLFCDKNGCFRCPDDATYNKQNFQCEDARKQCAQGFNAIKIQTSTNCYCTSKNCQYCDFEDGSKCKICNYNFALDNGNCIQCPNNYQYDKFNQKCLCDVNKCQQCLSNNGLKCGKCQDNYELTEQGFCKACQQKYNYDPVQQKCLCSDNNCTQCEQNDGSKCLICASNFELDPSTSECKEKPSCNVKNCKTCQANSVNSCQDCQEGYKLDSNRINCIIAIENCLELDEGNKSICKTCIDNYITFTQDGKCKCFFDNCKNCNVNQNICNQCEDGYSWLDNQCKCSIPNCQSCDIYPNYGNCKKCVSNYNLISNNICSCSAQNCKNCSSTDGSKCEQCQSGYVLEKTNKTCIQCQILNCQECQDNDEKKCKVCQDGYEIDSTNFTCKIKIQFCVDLSISDKSKCEKCQQNYIPSADTSKCECQFQNCNSCQIANSKCTQCENGFIWNDLRNKCECNLKNCQECQTSPYGICKTCKNGYFITQQGKCECGVQNCQQCNKDDGKICDNCFEKYVLDTNKSQCNLCTVNNCLTCKNSQPSKCEVCENGYKKDSSELCQINIEKCIKLNTSDYTICDQCESNYQFNPKSKQCECKVQNCFQCQLDNIKNICKQCQAGFQWDNSKSQCICNIANCQECSTVDYGACKNCTVGFMQKSRDQCVCSVNNCEKCDQLNGKICLECQKGFVQSQAKDQCKICEVPNCLECVSQNEKSCKQCQSGFSPKNLGAECKIELQNCIEIDPSSPQKCKKCDKNYVFDENFNCKCSIDNCKDCLFQPDGTCSQCQKGFKSQQDRCACDIPNCQECDTQYYGKCQTCNTNYLKSANGESCDCQVSNCSLCKQDDGKVCDQCNQDFIFRNGEKKECWRCNVENCLKCQSDNAMICQQCKNGYQQSLQDPAQCEIAIKNCIQLDTQDPSKCQKCSDNYKIDQNGQCICKVQFCIDCNLQNQSICAKCQNGFAQKDPNSNCECNLENCLECDQNIYGTCKKCIQGYKINANKNGCECNIQNCQQCNHNNGQLCDVCEQKHVLNDQKNKCELCQVQNCDKCADKDKNKCQQCILGFKVNQIGECEIGIEKCIELNATEKNKCTKCEENYNFNNNTSQPKCVCKWENCKSCKADQSDPDKCETCQDGHIWSSVQKNCVCNIQNCSVCNQSDYGKCSQCKSNFIMQDSNRLCSCQAQNCDKCSEDDGKTCVQCKENYILDNSSQQCMKCQVNNCLECLNNSASKCKTCKDNFQKDQNSQCIEEKAQCKVKNCKKCENKNENSCSDCKAGYKPSSSNGVSICIPAIDNCIELNQSNVQKCEKCSSLYQLDSSQTKCIFECNLIGCKTCDVQNNKICIECQDNFILNKQNNSCEPCKIDNCKVCSKKQLGSCQECEDSYTLFADSNNKNLCKQIKQYQTFTLKQNCTSKGYQIYINFEKELQFLNPTPTHEELNQIFNFTIGSKQNFTYTYSVRSKNEILLEIETEEEWKQETLQLQVHDNQFIENNKLSKQNDSLNLDPLVSNKKKDDNTSTNRTKEAAKTINTIAQSSAFPLALFGDFFKVFSMVDVTSYIYFLFYVNVDHPFNIEEFSKLFGSFQFQYIPNFIMPNFDNDHIIKSPEKFMNNNIDSFFLKNSSHSYSFLVLFLCVYVFLKVVSLLPLGRIQNIFKRSLKQEWEFNSFIYAAWIVFTYLCVACTLQARSYKMIDDLSRVSYSFFVITSIVLLSLPFIFFYLIFSRHQDLQLPRNQRKRRIAFFSIVRGLKINASSHICPETMIPQSLPQQDPHSLKDLDQQSDKPQSLVIDDAKSSQLLDNMSVNSTEKNLSQSELSEEQRIKSLYNPLCKYTNVLLFVRKILFCLIIVMLHDQTYVQISLLSTLNVLLALFFVICKPYIRKIDNINHCLTEVLFLTLQIISAYLKNYPDTQSKDDRMKLGWVYVAICLLLLLMHSLILIIDTAKSAIKFFKNLRKSSKIAPKIFSDEVAKKQDSKKIISVQIIDNKPSSNLTFEGALQSVEKALNQNGQKVGEDQYLNDIEKKKGLRKPRTQFFKRNPFLSKDQQSSFANLDNPVSNQNSNYNLNNQKIINNQSSTNITFNNDLSPVS
ncbi:hypothetical protein ABPG72_000634 [Tetrahymena utriculariae]